MSVKSYRRDRDSCSIKRLPGAVQLFSQIRSVSQPERSAMNNISDSVTAVIIKLSFSPSDVGFFFQTLRCKIIVLYCLQGSE